MVGYLVLENGDVFKGERIGSNNDVAFELVFNTEMFGYMEVFTDPSYFGQGLLMTYPLIGNYGVIPEDFESEKIWAEAIFVNEFVENGNNFRAKCGLDKFLKNSNIPGLKGVNTEEIAKVLKECGTLKGYLTSEINNIEEILEKIKKYKIEKPIDKVTCRTKLVFGKTKPKQIALIDYGVKHNIVNSLLKRNVGVTVYPAGTSAETILTVRPSGIVLSNGPGNPKEYDTQIEVIKKLCKTNIPILGIGLGHQLLAIAMGAKTEKLKYGHRGNYPIKNLKKDKVNITSQNHGYCVSKNSIDLEIAEIVHINLEDETIEGLKYKNKNIVSVQFQPEACPGPEDANYIFDEFVNGFYKNIDEDGNIKLLKTVPNIEDKQSLKDIMQAINVPYMSKDEKHIADWKEIGYELIRDNKRKLYNSLQHGKY